MATTYELHGRQKKVAALLAKIHEINGGPAQADEISALTPIEWVNLAKLAGVNAPSPLTIAAVIAEIRESVHAK